MFASTVPNVASAGHVIRPILSGHTRFLGQRLTRQPHGSAKPHCLSVHCSDVLIIDEAHLFHRLYKFACESGYVRNAAPVDKQNRVVGTNVDRCG